jgi:hypothetical protein
MVVGQRPLAGLRLAGRDPGLLAEDTQRLGRLRVDDAAAGDDQRTLRRADQLRSAGKDALVRLRPGDRPDPFVEEPFRHVERLRLNVLGQRQRHGSRLRRVDEHPHRLQRGRHDLLRPPDPVEVLRDGAEAVVHRRVAGPRELELLQHRVRSPGREHVTRQEQHGQAVHRCKRSAGDHVRRARADRRRAREGAEPVLHARVAGRRVDHPLLVARLVVRQQLGALVECLADPSDIAVAEDAKAAAEEAVLDSIPLDVLRREEADEGLRRREPDRLHR